MTGIPGKSILVPELTYPLQFQQGEAH